MRIRCLSILMLTLFLALPAWAHTPCERQWNRLLCEKDLKEPGLFEGCRYQSCNVDAGGIVSFAFECPNDLGFQTIKLFDKHSSTGVAESLSFNIVYDGKLQGDSDKARFLQKFIKAVVVRIQNNDDGTLEIMSARDKDDHHRLLNSLTKSDDRWSGMLHSLGFKRDTVKLLRIVELDLAILLLSVFAILFLFRFPGLWQSWRRDFGDRILFIVAIVTLVGLLIRLGIPYRLVMYYSGYGIINDAAMLSIGKYGAGGPLLYKLAFSLLSQTTESFIFVNVLVGSLTIPLASLWAAKRIRIPGVALGVALLLAMSPLMWKDHNSESILVICLFFFFLGNHFFDLWLQKRYRVDLLIVCVSFLFAGFVRPVFLLLVPFILLLRVKMDGIKRFRNELFDPLLIPVFLIGAFQVFWILLFAFAEWQPSNIWKPLSTDLLGVMLGPVLFFSHLNLFIMPQYSPVIYTVLLVFAFAKADNLLRIRLLYLLAMGIIFFSCYLVDQPGPSRARLQIPAQYFFVFISGAGLYLAYQWFNGRKFSFRKRAATGIIAAIAVVLSFSLPVMTLWEETNPDSEDVALSQIGDLLPDEPVILAAYRGSSDKSPGIFYTYPDYSLKERKNETYLLNLYQLRKYGQQLKLPVYFYLGMRCYLRLQETGPYFGSSDWINPACRNMIRDFEMTPVKTWEMKNIEDGFGWYPPKPTLKLGLYMLGKRRQQSAAITLAP